ncbi:MAG: hypothetical protein MUF52_11360 [Syntrophobacteraceae bacterium]|jgi:hypothetical protein|nr:hypothetical protein [Syntrophobacteraceae bacterium]
MTFQELKAAVMGLSVEDQKRLITEVIPTIWSKACLDDQCLLKVRELVDEDTVKKYRAQNMGGI